MHDGVRVRVCHLPGSLARIDCPVVVVGECTSDDLGVFPVVADGLAAQLCFDFLERRSLQRLHQVVVRHDTLSSAESSWHPDLKPGGDLPDPHVGCAAHVGVDDVLDVLGRGRGVIDLPLVEEIHELLELRRVLALDLAQSPVQHVALEFSFQATRCTNRFFEGRDSALCRSRQAESQHSSVLCATEAGWRAGRLEIRLCQCRVSVEVFV